MHDKILKKRKIVNCEKIESVMSHDLYPPPPVTNCHTFLDPLPPLERDILYGRPLSVWFVGRWVNRNWFGLTKNKPHKSENNKPKCYEGFEFVVVKGTA